MTNKETYNCKFWRFNFKRGIDYNFIGGLNIGDFIYDKGFSSFSFSFKEAMKFSKSDIKVILQLDISEEIKGIPFSNKYYTSEYNEDEIVLGPRSKFEIISKERLIFNEYLNQPKEFFLIKIKLIKNKKENLKIVNILNKINNLALLIKKNNNKPILLKTVNHGLLLIDYWIIFSHCVEKNETDLSTYFENDFFFKFYVMLLDKHQIYFVNGLEDFPFFGKINIKFENNDIINMSSSKVIKKYIEKGKSIEWKNSFNDEHYKYVYYEEI